MTSRELIDRWMPEWDFNTFHSVSVMRGIPALAAGRRDRKPLKLTLEGLQDSGFVILEEKPNREIVLGLLGRPWIPTGDIRRVTAEGFRDATDPALAKVVWNFGLDEADGNTQLTTETRALSLGGKARRNFRRYWRLIAPFSGAIRVEALWAVKRRAEKRRFQEELLFR